MTTIVFGGAGFVGLNIAEHLLKRGSDVTTFDAGALPPEAREHFATLPGTLTEVTGDVCDAASIQEAFRGSVDGVIYGAAITANTERDASEPERIIEVNLVGFTRALRAARDAKVRRVVNLSSSAAYGEASYGDGFLDEGTTVPDPTTLYSLTKFASEGVGRRLGDLWQLDVRSVRLSAAFGRWERQTSVRDTPSPPYQVMRAAIEGRPALLAREGRRDWTNAPDIASGVVAVLDAARLGHDLYNIACGKMTTLLDWGRHLADRRPGFVCRLCAPGEAPTVNLYGGVDRQPLGIDRLRADIGFTPRFDLEGAADDYDSWVRAHPDYI